MKKMINKRAVPSNDHTMCDLFAGTSHIGTIKREGEYRSRWVLRAINGTLVDSDMDCTELIKWFMQGIYDQYLQLGNGYPLEIMQRVLEAR